MYSFSTFSHLLEAVSTHTIHHHFLQPLFPLFVKLHQSPLKKKEAKRPDCVKEPTIKIGDEERRHEPGEGGKEEAGMVFKLTIGQGSDGILI